MTTLLNRALLVNLNISQWQARKLDKGETAAVNYKHDAATGAARVNKTLLPGAVALVRIHKLSANIRDDFYSKTLPWGVNGQQIIKATGYLDFTAHFARRIAEWEDCVKEFFDHYPTLVEDARARAVGLGTLYDPNDYPDLDQIKHKFRIGFSFSPVPDVQDWRVGLGDDIEAELRRQIEAEVMDNGAVAMKKAWERVHEVVTKTHERLSNPDHTFKRSLIENAKELCETLSYLNITDDPALEAIRQRIEGTLCATTFEALRDDMTTRLSVSDAMADVMSKMGGMYGN